jgi:hypothetical protein
MRQNDASLACPSQWTLWSSDGDGLPVTLRFADAIGEILTAAPESDIPETPLPFRHYI